jgi:hypothetical protein
VSVLDIPLLDTTCDGKQFVKKVKLKSTCSGRIS